MYTYSRKYYLLTYFQLLFAVRPQRVNAYALSDRQWSWFTGSKDVCVEFRVNWQTRDDTSCCHGNGSNVAVLLIDTMQRTQQSLPQQLCTVTFHLQSTTVSFQTAARTDYVNNCDVYDDYINGYCMPSVFRHCWFGVRKSIRPAKNLRDGVLAWLSVCSKEQWFAYGPADAPATQSVCFIKIQNVSVFLVVAGKRLLNGCK